jgi:hypothetical protein
MDSAGPMVRLDTLVRVVYRLLADLAVVVHFAFIAFVAVGAFMAWRWSWLVWLHVPSVIYSALIITVGFQCFLTPLEVDFRERAGEEGYSGGFVDRYIEDVVYPGEYTTALRALVAVAIVVGYVGLYVRRRRDREARRDVEQESR